MRYSWNLYRTSLRGWLAFGDAALELHPTLVVLESALGGLHGDNAHPLIGTPVGWLLLNHVTRTPVSNVWSCTDSTRTRQSSICSAGRWDEVGAKVCERGCTVAWPPARRAEPRSFPCWRRHPSLRVVVRACRDALCLPRSATRPCVENTTALIGRR